MSDDVREVSAPKCAPEYWTGDPANDQPDPSISPTAPGAAVEPDKPVVVERPIKWREFL